MDSLDVTVSPVRVTLALKHDLESRGIEIDQTVWLHEMWHTWVRIFYLSVEPGERTVHEVARLARQEINGGR